MRYNALHLMQRQGGRLRTYPGWQERLGAAVRTARMSTGMTQRALAAAVGISPSELSRIEHGSVAMTSRLIYRLAELMDLRPWELMALAELDDPEALAMAVLFRDLMRSPDRLALMRFLVKPPGRETVQ